ncbi:MAG: response regulator [Kiritimatiellia bacterium]
MSKVLLIDDEAEIVATLKCLLQTRGAEIVALTDSQEAADRLNRGEKFDLMMTDLRMKPVDGVQLITIARQKLPGMPVIVISAYLDDKTVEHIRDLGCRAYLDKPFSIEDVNNLLQMYLGKSG